MGNWIVLGILLLLVCVSAGVLYRKRRKGGCGCGCADCGGCSGNLAPEERQDGADAGGQGKKK